MVIIIQRDCIQLTTFGHYFSNKLFPCNYHHINVHGFLLTISHAWKVLSADKVVSKCSHYKKVTIGSLLTHSKVSVRMRFTFVWQSNIDWKNSTFAIYLLYIQLYILRHNISQVDICFASKCTAEPITGEQDWSRLIWLVM